MNIYEIVLAAGIGLGVVFLSGASAMVAMHDCVNKGVLATLTIVGIVLLAAATISILIVG